MVSYYNNDMQYINLKDEKSQNPPLHLSFEQKSRGKNKENNALEVNSIKRSEQHKTIILYIWRSGYLSWHYLYDIAIFNNFKPITSKSTGH